jgi:hypothetical protein
MIISIYAEKTFDKIEHPFMMKTQQIRYGRNISLCSKGHMDKQIANIILNEEN